MTSGSDTENICHVLSIYDGLTEDLVDVIEIPTFSLERFAAQFDVSLESDPQMLDRYAVGPDDAHFVLQAIGRSVDLDFSRFGYFIEAARR
mgnify:CR=1 FL=1